MADATLETAASPSEQPAPSEADRQMQAPAESPAPADAAATATETKLWAGRYQSPEELEAHYLRTDGEARRMAGEVNALKREIDALKSTTQTDEVTSLERHRQAWAQTLRRADLDATQRWEAEEQVRLYDREIARKQAIRDMQTTSAKQTAQAQLDQDGVKVLQAYAGQLVEGQPLYHAAEERFRLLRQMGYDDSVATKALAVSFAAQATGIAPTQAIKKEREAFVKTVNQQLKAGVTAGAGGAAPPSAPTVNWLTASKEDFERKRRQVLGLD